MLIYRYKKRIENFKKHIQNNNEMTFVYYAGDKYLSNNNHNDLLQRLCDYFKSKYHDKYFNYNAFI
jgi:hypothetical protein